MTRKYVGLALLALLLINCNIFNLGSADNPAASYGVERDEALFLQSSQPQTLDPALTHGGPDGALGHIFSGLVQLDPALRVQPDLAAGWELDETGTVYTFYLYRDAVFHDGRPLTAEDVIFSWERAARPQTGSDTALTYLGDIVGVPQVVAGEAEHIAGLRALDAHTLQVRIDAPKVYFLAKLAYPVAFVVDRDNVSEPDWQREPNGSGPYRLLAWHDDELMVLERNEDYYGEPPNIEHVVLRMDAGLPLARYEQGNIDLVGVGGANLERVEDPNSPLSSHLRTGVSMCTTYVGFNVRQAPFDDAGVRRAFVQAIDRERLVSGLMDGNALPAAGPLPPGMPGYTAREPTLPFDAQSAREQLAQAGYTPDNLPPLTYTTSGYGEVGAFEAAVISMWRENLGVTVQPQLLDPFTYNEELYAGNVGSVYSSGWCADYPDPQNFLDVLFHSDSAQNLGEFREAGIDAMLEEARAMADVEERLALYAEIEEQIVAQAPAVFVAHGLSAMLVQPRVQGYELTPIGVPQWHRLRLAN
ncbi:MAG: ABC transporter substrate-binding protein [Chloroflexota bacterium]